MADAIKLTDEQIERAARMMKIIHLCRLPGMDEVAIRLNCGPTYDEKKIAERWARAFELAATDKPAWECAAELVSMR